MTVLESRLPWLTSLVGFVLVFWRAWCMSHSSAYMNVWYIHSWGYRTQPSTSIYSQLSFSVSLFISFLSTSIFKTHTHTRTHARIHTHTHTFSLSHARSLALTIPSLITCSAVSSEAPPAGHVTTFSHILFTCLSCLCYVMQIDFYSGEKPSR